MKIGIMTEVRSGERRVALVPESLKRLGAKGVGFVVQSGAGLGAGYSDDDYKAHGAEIVASREAVLAAADTAVQELRRRSKQSRPARSGGLECVARPHETIGRR